MSRIVVSPIAGVSIGLLVLLVPAGLSMGACIGWWL